MKKLIFCFDGTCNEPSDAQDYFSDGSISNILKLHLYFGGQLQPLNTENSQTPDQQSYYFSGVGTRGNWLKRKFNALFAPPYSDMDDILAEANEHLMQCYQEGIEIFVFGFSRGAAIARMFAAQLKYPITFLGVFDTVAATRGSLDLNPATFPASGIVFENDILGAHIEEAVHLLALDEKRVLFQPTLFNKDKRITEVWFAGVHSDIGGSYWFDGLSDISLSFMLSKVSDRLIFIAPENINYQALKTNGAQDEICFDDLVIKPLIKGTLHSQQRSNMNAKTLALRVVRVNVAEQKSDYLPLIHHTVAKRYQQVEDYRPYSLRNLPYQVLLETGEISEPCKGVHDLANII
ncbi:T6SS phospholipase effector Tle1-like catalytic domain-containing protein [Litorilituus lipolyticus]|nr:DUF2235 domain-containing protein [Litorilituus lipolyticus]